tara:strand:+ start:60113 stop:60763 length:651 start_codon:yes stop_codon:yes gene_type:complete
MKFFLWTLILISSLLFISPAYSLYKIGIGIKEKDKEVLNGYILWDELQKNVKKDIKRFLKKRAKERKKNIDNPIDGIFEDIKRVGEKVFGGTALDIAVDKIVTPEGIIKLVELTERKKNRDNKSKNNQIAKKDNVKSEKKLFNIEGYSLETFKFSSFKNFEAKIITPDGDIAFKMRLIFPRWHLYFIQSDELSSKIASKIEESVDLLKNLKKGYSD